MRLLTMKKKAIISGLKRLFPVNEDNKRRFF